MSEWLRDWGRWGEFFYSNNFVFFRMMKFLKKKEKYSHEVTRKPPTRQTKMIKDTFWTSLVVLILAILLGLISSHVRGFLFEKVIVGGVVGVVAGVEGIEVEEV